CAEAVFVVASTSGCASVVPRKFPVAPFHAVVPLLPLISHANEFKLGRSAATNARNVGTAAAPDDGPAKTVLAVCVVNVPVNVPIEVTGDPLILNTDAGRESPTLVTPRAGSIQLIAPPVVELS